MTLNFISSLLPSCHPKTHPIAIRSSGWRVSPGLYLGLLCIKTQLYALADGQGEEVGESMGMI